MTASYCSLPALAERLDTASSVLNQRLRPQRSREDSIRATRALCRAFEEAQAIIIEVEDAVLASTGDLDSPRAHSAYGAATD